MKKETKNIITSLIFSLIETAIIFFIGKLIGASLENMLLIMVSFFFTRVLCGEAKHYNKWYRCLIWSLLVGTSMMALSDLNIWIIIILSAFTGYISSGKADIQDFYMWKNKGEPSKYQDIVEYIKYHPVDNDLMDFEEALGKQDRLLYMVYKYRFRDNLTFKEIEEKLDISDKRITEMLDRVALAIRIALKI